MSQIIKELISESQGEGSLLTGIIGEGTPEEVASVLDLEGHSRSQKAEIEWGAVGGTFQVEGKAGAGMKMGRSMKSIFACKAEVARGREVEG